MPKRSFLPPAVALTCILAVFGFAGQIDYAAEREAECSRYIKPRVWDKDTDSCVPMADIDADKINRQQPEDHYRAAPKKSHP